MIYIANNRGQFKEEKNAFSPKFDPKGENGWLTDYSICSPAGGFGVVETLCGFLSLTHYCCQ
jgi:hypothetical protein